MKLFFKRLLIGVLTIAAITGIAAYASKKSVAPVTYKIPEEKNAYVRFDMEAFDKIIQNYWAKTDEKGLSEHFQASLQKALNTPVVPVLKTHDRAGAAKMLAGAMDTATSSDARKNIAVTTLIVALYNLPPVGHAELLSAKQEVALRQNVSNVNPANDLYQNLGVSKTASTAEIDKAYNAKAAILAASSSPAAKVELKQIAHAKDVLTNPNTKDLYDIAKIEPTVSNNVMGKTLYIDMSKVSPSSFLEFGRTILAASTTPGLDSMILDLRGNVGGALDFAQNFLGLFLGDTQYAFDLYHQGDYNVQRTSQPKFTELTRYKDIAILTDGMTQSTAEVTTAAMERFHLAHVVGETTRGWGTVENTFPLDTIIDPAEKYSMLLVHSLTLRPDNQPVEGRGVDPDVNIKDANWKTELSKYFTSPSLITALKKVAGTPKAQ
jgi:hypothetical protein